MSRILAIDTTGFFGSIALVENGAVVEEFLLHSPDGFGHILFPSIRRLIDKHGWNILEIDCFVAAAGPGSFTGVRIGLSAVKGLAEAAGKPAFGVSNLMALAALGSARLRAAVLDARRGEVYGAVYDDRLNPVCHEVVTRFPVWLATLPGGDIEFVSPDFAPFRAALAGTRFENAPVLDGQRALAAAVARIADMRLARGELPDPAAVDANYVRRSDAELLWKE